MRERDYFLNQLRDGMICVALLGVVLLLSVTIKAVGNVSDAAVRMLDEFSTTPARLQAELDQTNSTIEAANAQWIALADKVSDRTTRQVTREVRESREEILAAFDSRLGDAIGQTMAELRETRQMVDIHLGHTNADVSRAVVAFEALQADTRPLIQNAEWWTRRNTVAPQVLGVLGATKVTMGQVAKMSKTINEATPQYIQSTQGIAESLDKRLKPKWYDRAVSVGVTGALLWSTTK